MSPGGWTQLWAGAERAAQAAIGQVLADHPEPTEPGVARTVVSCLAPGSGLVVASSMPIRDVEWYAPPRADIRVMANRGANGIDGMLSTTLGVAAGSKGGPTVGLLGDVAFLHDAGALVTSQRRGLDAVIVVIDNNGGGILGTCSRSRGAFRGLRPSDTGSAPPWSTLSGGSGVTTLVRLHFRCGLVSCHRLHAVSSLRFDAGISPDAGSQLPGTLVSPRTGLTPAGCPQLVARLHHANLLVVMAPKLLDARRDHPLRDGGPLVLQGHSRLAAI